MCGEGEQVKRESEVLSSPSSQSTLAATEHSQLSTAWLAARATHRVEPHPKRDVHSRWHSTFRLGGQEAAEMPVMGHSLYFLNSYIFLF